MSEPGYPPQRLRDELASARRRGESFESAWEGAVARALRGIRGRRQRNWFQALNETRDSWAAAYARRGTVRLVSAMETTQLAELVADDLPHGEAQLVA